ncbi:hypothetical protein GCM10025868_00050 [Angustibacter aerolatus]|uniref:Pyruvate dehydrogenase E1 component middle domain-containing protein n=1 Tax=Angustibacter aerolatus TaxID=1162965 RepID=A0ABQ6JC20_9ACTN|nr:hypothetical protein GCM10025868_00050 [Angustibacter aerolatus]
MRGNGKIIQRLEASFRGAGWNVVKVVWGREWDPLLAADRDGALVHLMNATPDGDYQTYRANDGAYIREHFFGRDPRTRRMVENLSDDDIWKAQAGRARLPEDVRRVPGGHAAHRAADGGARADHQGLRPRPALRRPQRHPPDEEGDARRPEACCATACASRSATSRLEADPYLPPYYHPGEQDETIQYLRERRTKLGGSLPARRTTGHQVPLPADSTYDVVKRGSGKQQVATTMAFVRLLKDLMRDKELGPRVVPIIPDEARTFGMDSFFSTAKIYNPHGQNYVSVDADLMLSYKEAVDGQILHVGINEAGSVAAFTAAGTSYATHGQPMLPVYVFYSMFGFQRTADSLWAAADQMTRGFLVGATAGRTTLTGEGLQHADGHSPLLASTNPAVVSYDPAYGYEIGHIVKDGIRRMLGEQPEDVFYYLTVYNEPIVQPVEPEGLDVASLLRGMYLLAPAETTEGRPRVRLLASGVAVPWALEAQRLLAQDFGVAADVWSVTSWNEPAPRRAGCRRAGVPRARRGATVPFVTQQPAGPSGSGGRGVRLHACGAGPDPPVGAGRLRDAGRRRLRSVRHPARRPPALPHRRVPSARCSRLAARGEVDASVPRDAATKYRLLDVTAGTSGNAGGDA